MNKPLPQVKIANKLKKLAKTFKQPAPKPVKEPVV